MNNKKIYLDYIIKKINEKASIQKMDNNKKVNIKNIKVACILDKFSYDCLEFEGSLHQLGVHNWKKTIKDINPNLLLVEATWQGYNQEWIDRIANMEINKDTTLIEITNYCKKNGITTVFWAKEDPNDFYVFVEAAKHFEYVFTPDINCIPKHKETLGHDKVYFLPLAAQPKLHNPIDKDNGKIGKVAFAGSWYKKFEDRARYMNNLLRPAKKYGLVIYNRFSYLHDEQFAFPDEYKPYIRKGLNYKDIIKEYKKYDIFLNVNSDTTSPTAFSRRIYELLACGIPTISSYNSGIENFFKDIVMLSNSEQDTEKYLEILLRDKVLRDKLSLLGQRKVFNNHTYKEVFEKILKTIKLIEDETKNKGVSVITYINNPLFLDNTLDNYISQTYPEKELILIINNKTIDLKQWNDRIREGNNIKILEVPESFSLGKCLNLGVEKSKYDYISIFDSKSYYGLNYLVDSLNTFKYNDGYIVGKQTFFEYVKYDKSLVLVNPDCEYRFTESIASSTLTFNKDIFSEIKFREKVQHPELLFIRDYINNGYKLYSSDRFNHVLIQNFDKQISRKNIEEKFEFIIV